MVGNQAAWPTASEKQRRLPAGKVVSACGTRTCARQFPAISGSHRQPPASISVPVIPSDPRQWWVRKSSGWLRWDKDQVEQKLRQEIRPDVLAQARRAGWDATLDCAARARLQEALRKALEVPDLSVKVQWR